MAQQRVDNIQVNAPKDIDNKKGVWNGSAKHKEDCGKKGWLKDLFD